MAEDDGAVTEEYQKAYRSSLENPEKFWGEVAQEIEWTRPWDRVLDNSNPPFTKWLDGLNIFYCLLNYFFITIFKRSI